MAIKQLESPLFKSVLADGSPNASGKVYVYAVNGNYQTVADQITTWTAKDKVTEHTHPIVLNAAGEAQIWFDNTVEIRVDDASDNLLYTLVGVSTEDAPAVVGNFNLVTNGSFELDASGSGSPDNWTLASGTGGTIAIDSTSGNQKNGTQSLKFTGTDSTGGGIATSDLFSVTAGATLETGLYFKQENAATGTYSLIIEWYTFDGSASSTPTSTAWSSASGAATAFTLESDSTAVPSDAVSAKLRLSGLLTGGSDVIGSCWFDHIIAFGPEAVTLSGTQTLTNKTLTSPTITGAMLTTSTLTTPTITNPAITGTVTGGATHTTPTLTDAVLNTSVSGTAFLDEDTMVSDSATKLASQQSIKAFAEKEAQPSLAAAVATTSGTIVTIVPTILTSIRRVILTFKDVSTSGTDHILIQLGDSVVETSGYTSSCRKMSTSAVTGSGNSIGYIVVDTPTSGSAIDGMVIIEMHENSSNTWVLSGTLTAQSVGFLWVSSGIKATGADVSAVYITTSGGTDTFDGGEIAVTVE